MTDTATLSINHDEVMALAAGGNSYRFLNVGGAALRQTPRDSKLRLQIVRHYAIVGLPGPALEEIAQLPEAVRRELEAVGVPQQLEGVPSGRVPWDDFEPGFEANLRVLAGRFPELERVGREWKRHRSELELYRCRDGNYQVSGRDADGRRVWQPRLLDHKGDAERAQVPGLTDGLMPRPYLLEGVGLGWFFQKLVDGTRHRFLNYSPAIYVLEPNLLSLAVALHLHDWRAALAEPRVFVLAGPDCGDRYVELLANDTALPLPNHHVTLATWGPRLDPRPASRVGEIQRRRDERCRELSAEVTKLYADCDAAHWARRYAQAIRGEGEPLRAAFMVSRHTTYLQYCVRDLAAAFAAKGMRTQILTEPSDFTALTVDMILQMLRSFRPEMFLVIDHFRHEYPGALPSNLPFVGWVQDQLPHLHDKKCGQALGPTDFFIARELDSFIRSYDYPAAQGLAWTAVGDDHRYSAEPMLESELAPHRCDVSFVTHQSKPPRKFLEEQIAIFDSGPQAARYMECIHDLLLRDFAHDPRTGCVRPAGLVLDEATATTGHRIDNNTRRDRFIRFFLHPLADLVFRQGTLQWVAEYCERTGRTLRIYGNGWEQHPVFAKYACGVAANGNELRAIYQASRINLQIMGGGCIHQRLLDGLLSGGFFLVRYSPFDVMHEAIRETLAAVDRYGLQPDTDYPAEQVPEFAEGLRKLAMLHGAPVPTDPVRIVGGYLTLYREQAAEGFRRVAGAVLPQYGQVSFATPEEFAARAERFLNDDAARREIAAEMRSVVKGSYTYGPFLDSLLALMQRRLGECAAVATADPHRTA